MSVYFYMLASFFIILVMLRVVFGEVEGRQSRKRVNIRYFLLFDKKFEYRQQISMLILGMFCYLMTSDEKMFSTLWLFELVGFGAVAMIGDAIGQVLYFYYVKLRFKKDIQEAKELKDGIEEALKHQDNQLMQQTMPNYNPHQVIASYFKEENHVAFVSVDGGEFVNQFDYLPPITYVVEGNVNKANETLANKGVKVTTVTQNGKMPFKDEKIDVIVNELANYDKFEMYRVLKPGGYFIVDQMGSDNYKEIINMFIPFKMKGQWNKEACQDTLKEIGFDIVDGFEDMGHLRFDSLSALLAFIKTISPERVDRYEQFINFYAAALKQLKKNHYYDLTTHRFLVVARKRG